MATHFLKRTLFLSSGCSLSCCRAWAPHMLPPALVVAAISLRLRTTLSLPYFLSSSSNARIDIHPRLATNTRRYFFFVSGQNLLTSPYVVVILVSFSWASWLSVASLFETRPMWLWPLFSAIYFFNASLPSAVDISKVFFRAETGAIPTANPFCFFLSASLECAGWSHALGGARLSGSSSNSFPSASWPERSEGLNRAIGGTRAAKYSSRCSLKSIWP